MKKYLTIQGLKKLKDKLSSEKKNLQNITQEKFDAWHRDGDGPHDNPLYHKLKHDEALKLMQISALQKVISEAILLDTNKKNTTYVTIGCLVHFKMRYHATDETIDCEFEICGYDESNIEAGKISYNSPIGSNLLNMKIGESKEVQLPTGKVSIGIEKIS